MMNIKEAIFKMDIQGSEANAFSGTPLFQLLKKTIELAPQNQFFWKNYLSILKLEQVFF